MRARLRLAAQQRRGIFTDCRQAARLEKHDRVSARGVFVQPLGIGCRQRARLAKQPL
jgi:hypothetical protein